MATSPNFSWPEPDNTDLVKNGALAIRTAVDAIDSSMADLKGGTTNQVLAKNSNTDMDFKWVADASGIPATILDAKGDLIAATAADTASRLAVGANGTVLTADSAEATGLKWATPASGMTNPMTTTGDTIYSSSGSTPARLGIGTTGQVLTVAGGVPSWATPSGSLANYALIGSVTTLSGSTTTISGISGKDSLFINIANCKANSSATFNITFNSDSGANYTYNVVEKNGTAATAFGGSTGDDEITIGASGATNVFTACITLFGTGSTGIKPFTFTGAINSGSNNTSKSGDGFYFGTSAISSVSIRCSAGTFDSGTIAVYGA